MKEPTYMGKCERCHERRRIQTGRSVCMHCRKVDHMISLGKAQSPDYTDITVDRYKEPMEVVKNGYGYVGAITETKDGALIQCHICGYFFGRLAQHVSKRHNVSPREYKIKYGLRIKDGLLSPAERERAQESYNRNARVAAERLGQLKAGYIKRRTKGFWRTGGNTKDTPQSRNEQGTCKAQTLAKIVRLAKMTDGEIVYKDFIREYGDTSTINHWFGSWSKALEAAGIETYPTRRRRLLHERAVDVPRQIKAFYKKHGRTPQSSDFNSANNLPSQAEVSRVYGSLNNARVAAGVPQLMHVGYGVWEEVK